MKLARVISRITLVLFLAGGLAGCDAIDDVFDPGEEVNGTVEAIGATSLTVGGNLYTVDGNTEFKGTLTGLASLHVGDEVEVEYENKNSQRVALEVELASDDED